MFRPLSSPAGRFLFIFLSSLFSRFFFFLFVFFPLCYFGRALSAFPLAGSRRSIGLRALRLRSNIQVFRATMSNRAEAESFYFTV